MLKSMSMSALTLMLGLPLASGAANLREMVGCKPDVDTSVVSREGLFTAHMVCDHLLLEIPDSLYDRDMLLSTEFAAISGGSDFIAPGTLMSNRAIRLNQRRIESTSRTWWRHRLGARAGTSALSRRSLCRHCWGLRHLAAAKGSDRRLTRFHRATEGLRARVHETSARRRRCQELLYRERRFSPNIGIRYYQTWVADNADLLKRVQEGEESVVASMGFVFYTNIYLLPDKPMRPRFWDSRVGYFATSFQDYGSGEHGGAARGFIQRYRLEKQNPKAPVSDPSSRFLTSDARCPRFGVPI
jgi:hypothetical protein